jgi:enterochelin esterase-like enzyme
VDGTVVEFTMNSADSKFYPGIARDPNTFGTPDPKDPAKLIVTTSHPAPYTRKVAVYVPKSYVPGTTAPLLVSADGPDRYLFATLDSWMAKKKLPAIVAVSIANGTGMRREASAALSTTPCQASTQSSSSRKSCPVWKPKHT